MIYLALKSLSLPQNRKHHAAAGGSGPSVTRLSSNGLFSTGPKLDNFCSKNIYFWFKPPLSYQNPGCASGCIHPADIFFKRLYRPHSKRANKRCRAYMYLFSKMNKKIVALKYQFLCAKVQSIL